MPEPDIPPATTSDEEAAASANGGEHKPEVFAVSPAIGPVPAIYVPQSPSEPSATGLLWQAEAEAARRARSWAACHLPHHDPGCRAHESPSAAAPPTVPKANPPGGTMPETPADLRYSKDHLWARPGADDGLVRVGVTNFAQQSLGDVVDVTLPESGKTVTAGEACGEIESVKSLSDLIAPVTGTVRARNDDLTDAPELVNTDPYGQGWMFEVETDPATLTQQLAALMDADAYRDLAGA
jgi:glycine cleavage system H protein